MIRVLRNNFEGELSKPRSRFRPCLRDSSVGYNSCNYSNDLKKIINKLLNLQINYKVV